MQLPGPVWHHMRMISSPATTHLRSLAIALACCHAQVLAAAAQKGYQPVKDHGPRFEVLVFESGKPTAAQDLASIANVTGVAESVKVTVMKSDSAGRPDQDVDGTAGPTPAKSVPKRRSRSLLQQASPATCPASELVIGCMPQSEAMHAYLSVQVSLMCQYRLPLGTVPMWVAN